MFLSVGDILTTKSQSGDSFGRWYKSTVVPASSVFRWGDGVFLEIFVHELSIFQHSSRKRRSRITKVKWHLLFFFYFTKNLRCVCICTHTHMTCAIIVSLKLEPIRPYGKTRCNNNNNITLKRKLPTRQIYMYPRQMFADGPSNGVST